MPTATLVDLERLAEGSDLEVKRAAGRDGRGELPSSFFESYSAMANTDGGVILLGVEEDAAGHLHVHGIADIARVQKALWDGLSNPQKASVNLLSNDAVQVVDMEGKKILRVAVPRASRKQRPVFLNSNPLKGAYRRNHEGDYICPEEVVKRMLAEQIEDARDSRILPRYGLSDLDASTFARFRNHFKTRSPDHPWNAEGDKEFLRLIGGFRRDRQTHEKGSPPRACSCSASSPRSRRSTPTSCWTIRSAPSRRPSSGGSIGSRPTARGRATCSTSTSS